MALDDFFGISLEFTHFQVDTVLKSAGLAARIAEQAGIRELIAENGREHPIVSIGKRQYALKMVKPLLDAGVLPYDALFHAKEVQTGSANDRRYAAEEKLLQFCLIVATGRTLKQLAAQDFRPDLAALRGLPRRGLYERFRDILADHTRELVMCYQQKRATAQANEAHKPPLWRRLFS